MSVVNLMPVSQPEIISRVPATESKVSVYRDRLFIKLPDRVVRLFLHDVLWVEAYDYYCKVITHQKEYLVTQTLKKLGEGMTDTPQMMRVHRSYIVNLLHIEEVGDSFIVVRNQSLPISKVVRNELLARWQKT